MSMFGDYINTGSTAKVKQSVEELIGLESEIYSISENLTSDISDFNYGIEAIEVLEDKILVKGTKDVLSKIK